MDILRNLCYYEEKYFAHSVAWAIRKAWPISLIWKVWLKTCKFIMRINNQFSCSTLINHVTTFFEVIKPSYILCWAYVHQTTMNLLVWRWSYEYVSSHLSFRCWRLDVACAKPRSEPNQKFVEGFEGYIVRDKSTMNLLELKVIVSTNIITEKSISIDHWSNQC